MKQTILLLTLVFPFTIAAQDTELASFPALDDNPVWSVEETSVSGRFHWKFRYSDDTLLCGKEYFKIRSYPYRDNLAVYIRVEDQRVYLRKDTICSDQDCLLYDFSLETGDSVFGCRGWYKAIEVDTISEFGVDRKRLKISGKYITTEWIEGICSTYHPLYPLVCPSSGICETSYNLLCLHNNDLQIYQYFLIEMYPDIMSCDGRLVGIKEAKNKRRVTIYPNPVSESIYLKTENSNDIEFVKLYAMDGRLVKTFSGSDIRSTVLDISGISRGVYILWVQIDGEMIRKKLRIQ